MARLTKSERLHFQTEWLDIWRKEGRPPLNQPNDLYAGALSPYSISHWGYAQQTYGPASRLSISLGNHNITRLVSLLGHDRLSGSRQYPMINIRSCAGRDNDIHLLRRNAFAIHREAALALRDVEALRACDLQLSIEKESEWLAMDTAQPTRAKQEARRL